MSVVRETEQIVLQKSGRARYERIRTIGKQQRVIDSATTTVKRLFADASEERLPFGCRWRLGTGDHQLFVMEDTPRVRVIRWRPSDTVRDTVLYSGDLHTQWGMTRQEYEKRIRSQDTFQLAFPYVVLLIPCVRGIIQGASLFFRKKALRTLDDPLLSNALPNVYGDGWMCLTHGDELRVGKGADGVERLVARIWSGTWNYEVRPDDHRDLRLSSPWHWEVASAQDATFMLRVHWREKGTVRRNAQELMGENGGMKKDKNVFQGLKKRILCSWS